MSDRINPFESKCNKCGAKQPKSKTQNIKSFVRYECGEKCDCGGVFVTYFNGRCIERIKDNGHS